LTGGAFHVDAAEKRDELAAIRVSVNRLFDHLVGAGEQHRRHVLGLTVPPTLVSTADEVIE
jgi:hypothetical protein